MSTFGVLLNVHLISITLSVGLLTLRPWWRYADSRLAYVRWTCIVPPVVDTVLLLSGAALMVKAYVLPFTEHGTWLTEKLFGVITYIVLGFIALDYRRARSQQTRLVTFPLVLVVLYIVIKLVTTKIPSLGQARGR